MLFNPEPPKEGDSAVEIRNYSIREVEYKDGSPPTTHIIGVVDNLGRATSEIKEINGKLITTRSGRVYELVGEPGIDLDAEYVWSMWCRGNEVASYDIINS